MRGKKKEKRKKKKEKGKKKRGKTPTSKKKNQKKNTHTHTHTKEKDPLNMGGCPSKTTPVGFEPTRGNPIGLVIQRLNRSAIASCPYEVPEKGAIRESNP